jgi:hypothetical protein
MAPIIKVMMLANAVLVVVASAALAATDNPLALGNNQIYEKSLAALTLLLVVAVLLENAFATIFNWRVFLAYFSSKGVKTIVMVVVSLIVVNVFDIDVVASLISAYKTAPEPSGLVSKFITALILAGGSAGIYNIMYALGYRTERRDAELNAKPPPDKAWVAVRVDRRDAKGDVYVKLREIGPAAGAATAPAPIAGTITFRRQSLGDLLFRRPNRFPQNGGYVVTPGVVYAITVEGKNEQGTSLKALAGEQYVFAPGAIVDFAVSL